MKMTQTHTHEVCEAPAGVCSLFQFAVTRSCSSFVSGAEGLRLFVRRSDRNSTPVVKSSQRAERHIPKHCGSVRTRPHPLTNTLQVQNFTSSGLRSCYLIRCFLLKQEAETLRVKRLC